MNNVDTTQTNTITHLSLCTGYEGIGRGLRAVLPNVREIAYVEIEAFAIANLVAKMETQQLDAAPIYTNLKTFPYRKFRGQVDILSGGFPCQGFSQAGKQKGVDDPRHLFPFIAEGIRECKPQCVFLENVEGIISCKTHEGESVLQYVLRTLEGLGYRTTAGIFSASEVGAPHQRKRVFILGYSQHDGSYGTEESRGTPEAVRDNPQGADAASQPSGAGASTELAYRISAGLEGYGGDEQGEGRQSTGQSRSTTASCLPLRWPARPSEQQYEWEEPRVTAVGDTESQQGSPSNNGGEPSAPSEPQEVQPGGGHCGSLRESNGQAEPRLGRATNGASSRVDRLRLLGNGVVPLTATKAFTTLLQRVL